MSQMNEEREKQELEKLRLEVLKLDQEIKVLGRRPIFHPSAYIPLIAAMITVVGGAIKLNTTTTERNEAKADAQVAEKSLTSAIAKASPGQLKIVNVRFRGTLTREQIAGLQQKFNQSGIITPRAERTPQIETSAISYYDDADKALADSVAAQVMDYFANLGCPFVIAAQKSATSINPGTVNLAIYQSCN